MDDNNKSINNIPLITIFTPTFNRQGLLSKLWISLNNQLVYNFKWVIVDDGSTDSTRDYIDGIKKKTNFKIEYYYQSNSGKHIAHNLAVENCDTELFYCVDSDDYLPEDATKIIEENFQYISNNDKISGIVGYKAYFKGNIVGNKFPDIKYSTLKNLYSSGKTGDTALIYKSKILKNFPFKQFIGEKFLRESTVYDLIDQTFELLVIDKILYFCEYLDDGLSKQAYVNEYKNPNGAALFRYMEYLKSVGIINKVRNLSAFVMFSIIAKKKADSVKKIGLLRFITLMPIALLGYFRLKFKVLKIRKR